jgi:hypothetical protein
MAPVAIGVSVALPLGPNVPVQPESAAFELPDATQLVARVEDQAIEVVAYAAMEVAPSVSTGVAGAVRAGVAVKVTEAGADGPPRLLQIKVNVSVPTAVGVMGRLPLDASAPPQLPDAAQLVAPTEDHASVVEWPTATEFAANDRVGAAGGVPDVAVSVADPAADVPNALVQVNVYVVAPAAVGVSVVLPLAICAPLQLPDALQPVASIADQVSTAEPPSGMDGADNDRVGTTSAVSAWMNP